VDCTPEDAAADSEATADAHADAGHADAAAPLEGIAAALQAFVGGLRSGVAPMGEVHENLMSLAMVEAAVQSAETGRRVLLDDVLARALEDATAAEPRADVRAELATALP
jgi:hypothetical protein